jgi:hydroxymethylglutaryl-CoA reductase (NADPH)
MEVMMPTIVPSFLLKKLYIKGSFKNTPNGFQLALRNTLAPGTLIGVGPLSIDGRGIPLDKLLITVEGRPAVRASDISGKTPSLFPLNKTVTFQIEDQPLAGGNHHVTMAVNTKEAGELKIDAEDSIE